MATSETTAAAPPVPGSLVEVPYRRKVLLVGALTVTLFVTTMNQTVVATAAQSIVADIGGFHLFTWLFAGFALTSAAAVPIVGKLSDLYGNKPVIITSLALFLVASGACGAALNMEQLLVARAFQGIGFAGVMGCVWIIMAALWEPKDRAKWMGVTAAGFTLSGVLGPVIGGTVSDALSWRWIFYLNLPVGGVAFFLLWTWFPGLAPQNRRGRFDIEGAIAFTVAISVALLALSVGGEESGWTSPMALSMYAVAAIALALFIRFELRAEDPLIPLGLFRSRVFSGAMAASLTVTVAFVVTTVFLPLYVQGVRGQSATTSALPLMTMAVGVAIGSNIAGQILGRAGYVRVISASGLTLAAITLAWMSTLAPDTPMILLVSATLVLGLGVSFGFTSFTAPVQNAMPITVLGVVTTSLQLARVFGTALGAAALGALLLAQISSHLGAGDGPRGALADPEALVSEQQLAEIRQEFIAHPDLGEADFEQALAESRVALGDSLNAVFKASAVVTGIGIALAIFTFSAARREDEPPGA
ncbi:MAG: MFS transporter [Dehalococcoidia bacterium]